MNNLNTKYESQALAMTMVVLVVSAILGLSIYSRSMKDKLLTLEERASAEALEVSDLTLERLLSKPIDVVVNEIEQIGRSYDPSVDLTKGIVLREYGDTESGEKQITQLLRTDNIELLGSSEYYSELFSEICPLGIAGNEYQLTLKLAEDNYEVRAGHTWSLPAKDLLKNKDCILKINVETAGDDRVGFILSKYFCKYNGYATQCEKYEVGSGFSKGYCFSNSLNVCNDAERFYDTGGSSEWEKILPEGGIVSINMSASNSPSEVRITAVGGTINVGYDFVNSQDQSAPACWDGLRMYQLRATANCSGVYRGKEVLVPEAKSHDSLFDYVVFNNRGPF